MNLDASSVLDQPLDCYQRISICISCVVRRCRYRRSSTSSALVSLRSDGGVASDEVHGVGDVVANHAVGRLEDAGSPHSEFKCISSLSPRELPLLPQRSLERSRQSADVGLDSLPCRADALPRDGHYAVLSVARLWSNVGTISCCLRTDCLPSSGNRTSQTLNVRDTALGRHERNASVGVISEPDISFAVVSHYLLPLIWCEDRLAPAVFASDQHGTIST